MSFVFAARRKGSFLLKVLIAEDDTVIAGLLEDILVDHGYAVCGIAGTVAEAVALARRHAPDLAVIDLRLADNGLGTDIVAELGNLGQLGILYTTGASQTVLTTGDGHARLAKPFRDVELLRSLEIVLELVSSGLATPPFPRGFQLLPAAIVPRL
jgi:DNA-binding response OmpR family regulator